MNFIFGTDDFDRQEALTYHPGQRVELKANPGVVDIIAEYDPMMVPPIWLENDPKPRYPHELNLLAQPIALGCWLGLSKCRGVERPRQPSRVQLAASSK